MRKILFFDNFLIDRQHNLVRLFHEPEWLPQNLFVDRTTLFGGGYSSVVPAPEGKLYLYYATMLAGGDDPDGSCVLCMAEGADGLNWQPKTFVPPRKAGYPQVVYAGEPVAGGCHVYFDPDDPDPSRRYKMTDGPRLPSGWPNWPNRMLYSPDGVAWRIDKEHCFFPRHSDTFLHLLRNHRTGRYQIHLRRTCGERRVFRVESADLQNWSEPALVLHPDPLDSPGMQFYGMPQFRYGDIFVGFLQKYQTFCDDPHPWKMAGIVETELVYSYDGLTWNRTHRPFLKTRERGEYGGGSMYGTALLERADDLIVYAIAGLKEHHHYLGVKAGADPLNGLLPGRLRKDGFVSLATPTGRGEFTTAPLYFRTPDFFLNVKASLGGVKVQLCNENYEPQEGCRFDDCEEIKGDHLAIRPGWRNNAAVSAALSRTKTKGCLRIQICLDQAQIYGISGDFGLNYLIGAPGEDNL